MTGLTNLLLVVAGCLLFILLSGRQPAASGVLVPGAVVSQPFGCTALALEPVDVACPGGHFHSGVDLAAPAGTPVLAPGAGQARIGRGGACGIHVVLDHGAGVSTLYCHLAEAVVADGAWVVAGDRIGSVGSTGLATGPHVHFEVHLNGRPVDPADWLSRLTATGTRTDKPTGGK